MYTDRPVTERDMRDPKFPKSTDPSEYEFRADGAIVRKDRWEVAVRNIASILEMNVRDFEINDVVQEVRQLKEFYDEHKNDVLEEAENDLEMYSDD